MQIKKRRNTGEAIALLLSTWLGLAAVTGSHIWSVAYPTESKVILLKLAVWVPGFYGIGVYAGKETFGLLVWLISWLVLFFLLRNRDYHLKPWIYGFFVGFILVVLATWPPVYHAFLGWPPGVPD